jgi:hypothetical protein
MKIICHLTQTRGDTMSIKLLCITLSLVTAAHGSVTMRVIERPDYESMRLDLPKFMGILEDLNEPARAESYACKHYLALLDKHGYEGKRSRMHTTCNNDDACNAISVDQGEICEGLQ